MNGHAQSTAIDAGNGSQAGMGMLPWLRVRVFGETPEKQASVDGNLVVDRTDTLIRQQAVLGLMMLAVIAVYAAFALEKPQALRFFVWGTIAAFVAFLIGIALGLLFGLPSTRGWSARAVTTKKSGAPEPANGAPPAEPGQPAAEPKTVTTASVSAAGAGAGLAANVDDFDIPYDENTSLEQIADWLTKIIVGLSLTQYPDMRAEFGQAAAALSLLMLPGTPAPGPVPGSLILIGFSILGFLIAYLWMRRYFIAEMVIARRSAVDQIKVQAFIERQRLRREAQADADAQVQQQQRQRESVELKTQIESLKSQVASVQARPVGADTAPSTEFATGLADQIRARLPQEYLQAPLERIIGGSVNQPYDPEDPWKGRFGGAASNQGFTLGGNVVAVEGDPNLFTIDLHVTADTPQAKQDAAGRLNVFYFLHPTFATTLQRVAFGNDGIAPTRLLGYGAFTVGVLIENGVTLELNLASLESAREHPIFLNS